MRVIRRHPGVDGEVRSRFRPVSRHGIPLEAFPRVFPSSEHLLPGDAAQSSAVIRREQIRLAARLEAVAALASIQIVGGGGGSRGGRDDVVSEVGVAAGPAPRSFNAGRLAPVVVVARVVAARTVAVGFLVGDRVR